MGGRIYSSRQLVRQRLVEHVVGHLTSGIAVTAHFVPEVDLEAAQAWFNGGQDVDSAAAILLTVEREIVFEHHHGELPRRIRRGLRNHRHGRGLYVGDWIDGDGSAAHAVANGASAIERVGRIARQDRNVVPLGGV